MSEDRLSELRQRWEADPRSRVFLQLAEEHRRLGQARQAITVLEKGLEQSPNHLSAQVALGRCYLELGENERAVEILGRVLDRDPTQLVANKLLVEAHLELGNHRRAELQLERYSQLNSGDPIIDGMRERLVAARREAAPESPAPPKKSAALLEDVEPLDLAGTEEDLVAAEDAGAGDAPPSEPFLELSPQASPRRISSMANSSRVHSSLEDPFPELGATEAEDQTHLESLGQEGLFPVAEAPAAHSSEASTSPEEDLFSLEPPSPSSPAVGVSADEDIFGLGTTPAPRASHAEAALEERDFERRDLEGLESLEVATEAAPQEPPPRPVRAPVETNFDRLNARIHLPAPRESQDVLEVPEAPDLPDLPDLPSLPELAQPPALVEPVRAHAPIETNFDALDAKIHHGAQPEQTPAALKPPVDAATVTLGNLYRQQGHEDQAQEVFRAVLDRDPSNVRAREALGESWPPEASTAEAPAATSAPPAPVVKLTAHQLLAGADASLSSLDLKALLLKNYLLRLRREA